MFFKQGSRLQNNIHTRFTFITQLTFIILWTLVHPGTQIPHYSPHHHHHFCNFYYNSVKVLAHTPHSWCIHTGTSQVNRDNLQVNKCPLSQILHKAINVHPCKSMAVLESSMSNHIYSFKRFTEILGDAELISCLLMTDRHLTLQKWALLPLLDKIKCWLAPPRTSTYWEALCHTAASYGARRPYTTEDDKSVLLTLTPYLYPTSLHQSYYGVVFVFKSCGSYRTEW